MVASGMDDVDVTQVSKLLDQIADVNLPDTTISSLQNDLVKLIKKHGPKLLNYVESSVICSKLAVQLKSQQMKIRANNFRCYSLLLQNKIPLQDMLESKLDIFLVRAIDVGELLEGVEALRFVYTCCKLGELPNSLTCCLLSIVESYAKDPAYMKCATAIICEYALDRPKAVIECGGIKALLFSISLGGSYPETEITSQIFIHLLNNVSTRSCINIQNDIGCILAPLTDQFFILYEKKPPADTKKEVMYDEDREVWLEACKNAILSIIRTWPGIYAITPYMKELLQSLLRPVQNIQRSVLKLLYSIFLLEEPSTMDSFEEALSTIIEWQPHEGWAINDDWIVGESAHYLSPHHIERPNLINSYQAVILTLLFSVDKELNCLTHVAVNGEKHEAILASVLIGELLHLINLFDLNTLNSKEQQLHTAHILPRLVESVAQHEGYGVESAHCITKLLHHRQNPHTKYSYHLKLIMDRVKQFNYQTSPFSARSVSGALKQTGLDRDDRLHLQFIEDTKVLLSDDFMSWNWSVIGSIIESHLFRQNRLDETCHRFFKKVMSFYQDFSLSTIPYCNEHSEKYTNVGIALMNLLIDINIDKIDDLKDLIPAFLRNMVKELNKTHHGAGIFTTKGIKTTLVGDYFFMIGNMSGSHGGLNYLKESDIFKTYLTLFDKSKNKEILMRCITVSLVYGKEGITDVIFNTILRRGTPEIRIFAIGFLRTLIRSGYEIFVKFILPMLINQLYARSEHVRNEALDVLTEACEDPTCLEYLYDVLPALQHLGDKGYNLVLRFLSLKDGFALFSRRGFVDEQIDHWIEYACRSYVKKTEVLLLKTFSTYKNSEAAHRTTDHKFTKYCFAPVHLYGELAQMHEGLQLLKKRGVLEGIKRDLSSEDMVTVKSAVWSAAHVSSSYFGLSEMMQLECVAKIAGMAREHENLGVRGSCFYALNLISKTDVGALAVEQHNIIPSKKEFHHVFNICQKLQYKNLSKINVRYSYAGSEGTKTANRQRSSTLHGTSRTKTHVKHHSLGGMSDPGFVEIQKMMTPDYDQSETIIKERVGLCVPGNIQEFFKLNIEFEGFMRPIDLEERGEGHDEDTHQLMTLIISLSSSLRQSVYHAAIEEMVRKKPHLFTDFTNYIYVNTLMSQYKFRQHLRKYIHRLFDGAVTLGAGRGIERHKSTLSLLSQSSNNSLNVLEDH